MPAKILEGAGAHRQSASRAMGQPAEARRSFLAAIATIESLRHDVAGGGQQQQSFLENKLSPWLGMIDLLVSQKEYAEALSLRRKVEGAGAARHASVGSRQPPPIAFAAGATNRRGAALPAGYAQFADSRANCGATNLTHRAWLS